MESDQQSPTAGNPNGERASNIQGTLTPGDVLVSGGVCRPDNQLVTYHRRVEDGEYVAVHLSPEFGFCPRDDKLVTNYLNKKINGEEAPYIRMIPTINVYKHSPQELAESHQSLGEDEWYFFSSRDRKYMNGARPDRAAGDGYWKATGADKKLYNNNGESVGSRKCLVFYEGKPPYGKKTNWVMLEYVGNQPRRQRTAPDDMRLDDCVLCRIYKKSHCSPKRPEEQAAASESGKTEKSASRKSYKIRNRAAPQRKKNKHEGTNYNQQLDLVTQPYPTTLQQNRLQVLHTNLPPLQQNVQILQPSHPTRQKNNLQVLHPNLPPLQQNRLQVLHTNLLPPLQNVEMLEQYSQTPQQNRLQVLHPNLPPLQKNRLQVLHPNLPPLQQNVQMLESNPQTTQQNRLQVLHPNLPPLQQNVQMLEPNPQTTQQNHLQVLHPNLTPLQQNAERIQYGHQAGSHDLGQPDCSSGSVQDDTKQIPFDDFIDIYYFSGLGPSDIVENQACTSAFQNGYGHPTPRDQHFDNFDDFSSFGHYFKPNPPPPLGNNDHPPDGH